MPGLRLSDLRPARLPLRLSDLRMMGGAILLAFVLLANTAASAVDLSKFDPLPRHMAACADVRDDIRDAARRFMPRFPHWQALMAQAFQESRCKMDAVSPVGAEGPMQIMPGTARDLARRHGRFNVTSRQAFAMGARYQNAQMHQFRGRDRPAVEAWRLGLASYNSGLGNVLKAQRACENRRDWRDIQLCQKDITGPRNAHETRTYVRRIERWAVQIDPDFADILRGPDGTTLRGYFYFGDRGQAPGTFWELGSGWTTAGHVINEQGGTAPPFIDAPPDCRPGVIDVCLMGVDLAAIVTPPRLVEKERVILRGVPGGAGVESRRTGFVYYRRPHPRDGTFTVPTTIVVLDPPKRGRFDFGPVNENAQPVFVGMSGGVVEDLRGRPRGWIVASGSPTQLFGDSELEQSVEVVDIVDAIEVFK